MRLSACLGTVLLVCVGCAQLPKKVRVEVDGHSVEFEKPKVEATADDGRR